MRQGKRMVRNAAKQTGSGRRSFLLTAIVSAALLLGACADAAAESGGSSSDGELVTVNAGNDLAAIRGAAEDAVNAATSPADHSADEATIRFLSSRHATLQAASDAAAALAAKQAAAERAAAANATTGATEGIDAPAVTEQAVELALTPARVTTTEAAPSAEAQQAAAEQAAREAAEKAAREAAEQAAREQAQSDAAAAARDKAAIEAASKPAADKAAQEAAARQAAADKAAADKAAQEAVARKAAADKAAQDEAARQASAQQAAAQQAAAAPAAGGPYVELESQFLQLINAKRAQLGVAPLVAFEGLLAPARTHAADMARRNVLEHQDLTAVLSANSFNTVGENVGYGPSVQVVHDALVASPGHYANLANPAFTHIGIAVYVDTGGKLWTAHVFGG